MQILCSEFTEFSDRSVVAYHAHAFKWRIGDGYASTTVLEGSDLAIRGLFGDAGDWLGFHRLHIGREWHRAYRNHHWVLLVFSPRTALVQNFLGPSSA